MTCFAPPMGNGQRERRAESSVSFRLVVVCGKDTHTPHTPGCPAPKIKRCYRPPTRRPHNLKTRSDRIGCYPLGGCCYTCYAFTYGVRVSHVAAHRTDDRLVLLGGYVAPGTGCLLPFCTAPPHTLTPTAPHHRTHTRDPPPRMNANRKWVLVSWIVSYSQPLFLRGERYFPRAHFRLGES